jgi:DNA-binding HxlR family transcriptional regulator
MARLRYAFRNATYFTSCVSKRNCYFRNLCVRISAVSHSSPDIDAFRAAALRCPLPQAIELIGEKWAFLILRGALNGLQHFEQFQAGLGIARNILSNRLARMVEGGILARTADPLDGRKVVYALTPKGEALLPVVIALRQWGEDWGHGTQDILLADQRDGKPVRPIRVLAEDGRELELHDLMWVNRSNGAVLKREKA